MTGAVKKTTQIVMSKITHEKMTVAFNKCVSLDEIKSSVIVIFNDVSIACDWLSSTGYDCDCLWICNPGQSMHDNLDIKVWSNVFSKE